MEKTVVNGFQVGGRYLVRSRYENSGGRPEEFMGIMEAECLAISPRFFIQLRVRRSRTDKIDETTFWMDSRTPFLEILEDLA